MPGSIDSGGGCHSTSASRYSSKASTPPSFQRPRTLATQAQRSPATSPAQYPRYGRERLCVGPRNRHVADSRPIRGPISGSKTGLCRCGVSTPVLRKKRERPTTQSPKQPLVSCIRNYQPSPHKEPLEGHTASWLFSVVAPFDISSRWPHLARAVGGDIRSAIKESRRASAATRKLAAPRSFAPPGAHACADDAWALAEDPGRIDPAIPERPLCPGCGLRVGVYEPIWRVAPNIGAEPTWWLHLGARYPSESLWHAECAEGEGIDGG